MSTVTQEITAIKPDWSRRFEISLYLIVAGALLVTAFYAPGLIRFWPFSVMEIVHRIAPLFMISLFIERGLEVFVTAWRSPDAAIRDHRISSCGKPSGTGTLMPKLKSSSPEFAPRRNNAAAVCGGSPLPEASPSG